MKGAWITALVVVAGCVLATAVSAALGPAATAQEVGAEVRGKTFVGVVVSVSTSAKTLVVKGKKGEKTFDVATAKYATGTTLEELKAGDNVGVEYLEKGTTNVATLIGKVRPRR